MNQMKLLQAVAVAAAPAFALAPGPVFAAHAGAPYTNVDHSNDMGNDTGDSRVDGLNSSQLIENYQGPVQLRAPADSTPAMPPAIQAPVMQPPVVQAPGIQAPASPPPR
jgi:hypothetical protein